MSDIEYFTPKKILIFTIFSFAFGSVILITLSPRSIEQFKLLPSTLIKTNLKDNEQYKITITHNFTSSNDVPFPNICNKTNLELIICVPTRRSNKKGRDTIRETWGSFKIIKNTTVAMAFFIGAPYKGEDPSVQGVIDKEISSYHDIIQGSFIDSYRNLTKKSMFLFKWVAQHCNQSKFILKADDDMFINTPLLIDTLHHISKEVSDKPFVVGSVKHRAPPIRNPHSKWSTTREEFPAETYPGYTIGSAYAMSAPTAIAITNVFRLVQPFWLEDVFITGMCREKAGVILRNDPRFSVGKTPVCGEYFKNHISGHHMDPPEIKKDISRANE